MNEFLNAPTSFHEILDWYIIVSVMCFIALKAWYRFSKATLLSSVEAVKDKNIARANKQAIDHAKGNFNFNPRFYIVLTVELLLFASKYFGITL